MANEMYTTGEPPYTQGYPPLGFDRENVATEPHLEDRMYDENVPRGTVAPIQPGSKEAGLQAIQQGIMLLSKHSAANVGGSMIGEALVWLERGYAILVD